MVKIYKLLIVDDEEKIRNLIEKYAKFQGYETYMSSNGLSAIEIIRKGEFIPDIIIMDVMMPELDGFSAVKEIKKIKDIPVIMLSARGEEYDKIHGFELGIDDYVVKPFSPRELIMRIEAVMNRFKKPDSVERDIYEKDGLMIDLTGHIITINEERIQFSPKEYDLLVFLLKNQNIALSRELILEKVWGYDFYGDDRTLDTHIKLLRKSLREYSGIIVTIRGVGYRLDW